VKPRVRFFRIFLIAFCIVFAAELILRFGFGFGDPPLFYASDKYEYFYQPHQKVLTFHNRLITNEFGMRSGPAEGEVVILKIGDSVIHGGVQTDHDSLASTKLEKKLRAQFERQITVLNISAGSWGVDNAAAFLEKHGDFGAKIVVMVFSSHDLRDNMSFDPCVGIHPSFPESSTNLALVDFVSRYAWPKIFPPAKTTVPQPVNPAWNYFFDRIRKQDWHFLFVLHPDINEIAAGTYNEDGQQLLKMLAENDIAVIRELESGAKASMYRDEVHFNDAGQNQLVTEIYPWLTDRVEAVLQGR